MDIGVHRIYYCSRCNKRRLGSRLRFPRGWMRKRKGCAIYCYECRASTRITGDEAESRARSRGKAYGTQIQRTMVKTK
jgi:hypothetical protein